MDTDLSFRNPLIQYKEPQGIEEVDLSSLSLEMDRDRALFDDSPALTIHAHQGSTAEAYAKEHGIRFEMIE